MLFETLDRIKRNVIMAALVLMFAGNVLMLTPERYVAFLGSACGFALAVASVTAILAYVGSGKALIDCIRLFLGLVEGIVAVCLFVFDDLFANAMYWLVGVVPILMGIWGLYHAFAFARRSGRRGWWVLVVLSGSLAVFGGFVFWNPWMGDFQAAMRVVGGTLMYAAVVSALSLVWIWPAPTAEEA